MLISQVVNWFILTRNKIHNDRGGKPVPSLAFVHIPPSASRGFQKTQLNQNTEPGLNEEAIGTQANGHANEDTPFMQAIANTAGLLALFVGHDHGVDWYECCFPHVTFSGLTSIGA